MTHWDEKANKIADSFGKHFNQLAAFKAADDVRRGTLPAAPDAYKLDLPKDFQPPVGMEWKWDEKDPVLGQARAIAHELGIPQEGFSKLLGLYAATKLGETASFADAGKKELEQLGAAGPQRIDALTRWAEAQGLKNLPAMFVTAGIVRDFEALITRFTNGGAAPFNAGGRDPQGGQRLSAEEYNKLTFAQKQEYARKFPQESNRGQHPTKAA